MIYTVPMLGNICTLEYIYYDSCGDDILIDWFSHMIKIFYTLASILNILYWLNESCAAKEVES